jgi:hypothetical protein
MRQFALKTHAVTVITWVVAGALRWLNSFGALPDFWGDAYHHWLISRLTLANGWVYSDYKGMETIWLPAYHFLISAVMAVSGRLDLAPARLTNLMLGTLACGLVTRLVTAITHSWRTGLLAGLTLALLPWHIAYSNINMPEVMAGLLLLLILFAARRGHAGRLAGLAFIGTLTRYELILLLAIVGLWLLWRRQWRALLGVMMGSTLALVLWSAWSWQIAGEALVWWRRSRAATAWDARYWYEAGMRLSDLKTLGQAMLAAFPPLVVVGPVVAVSVALRSWRRRIPPEGWLLIALAGGHWLATGLGFAVGHLPLADPRYLLVSLPALAGGGAIAVGAIPCSKVRLTLTACYAVFLVVALTRQLPTFPDKAYVLAPEKLAGEYLGAVAPVKAGLWVDAPVAIYYSGLGPERFLSSDRLLPDEARWLDTTPDIALAEMVAYNVSFVLWEDAPYSFVKNVWPQMTDGQTFEQGGYRFEPVFRFEGWELDYGARPTILWRIVRVSDD